jgi:flagellar protein FliS
MSDDDGRKQMAALGNAYKAYRSAEVDTISQRDLLVKLFEGAMRFLREAQAAIRNHEIEARHTKCMKAKRIFIELLSTLNFDKGGEVAGQLRDLYLFVITEISAANLRNDAEAIGGVLKVVEPLLEAWRSIPEEFANVTSLSRTDHQSYLNIRT